MPIHSSTMANKPKFHVEVRGHKRESQPLTFKTFPRQQLSSTVMGVNMDNFFVFQRDIEDKLRKHIHECAIENAKFNWRHDPDHIPSVAPIVDEDLVVWIKVHWYENVASPTTLRDSNYKAVVGLMEKKDVFHVIIDMHSQSAHRLFD